MRGRRAQNSRHRKKHSTALSPPLPFVWDGRHASGKRVRQACHVSRGLRASGAGRAVVRVVTTISTPAILRSKVQPPTTLTCLTTVQAEFGPGRITTYRPLCIEMCASLPAVGRYQVSAFDSHPPLRTYWRVNAESLERRTGVSPPLSLMFRLDFPDRHSALNVPRGNHPPAQLKYYRQVQGM